MLSSIEGRIRSVSAVDRISDDRGRGRSTGEGGRAGMEVLYIPRGVDLIGAQAVFGFVIYTRSLLQDIAVMFQVVFLCVYCFQVRVSLQFYKEPR